jgi:SSS family solute:Na+ symporter
VTGAATVIVVVVIYLGITTVTGILADLRREFSISEYVAASGSLNLFVMYFLMGGAIFSAFAFLGGPGWAFSRGAASFYILAYCAMGLLPWYMWGPRAYRLGKRYGYVTQAELLSDSFQSPLLSAIVAIVSILAFIQYIALQLKGMGYVMEVTTGGVVPFWLGALVAYMVVMVYVFLGGVRGVGWTNVLQGLFMLALAWVLGLYLPYRFHGGIGPMFEKIAAADPTHLVVSPPQMGWAAYSTAILVSVWASRSGPTCS